MLYNQIRAISMYYSIIFLQQYQQHPKSTIKSRTYNLFFDFEKFAPKYIFESPLMITATNSQYQIKNCQYIQGTEHLQIVTGQNEGFKYTQINQLQLQMMAFMQNKDNQLVEPLGAVECLTIKDNQVVKKWEKLFQLQGQCLHYSDSTLVIGFAKGQIIVYQLDSELSEPTIQTSYYTHKGCVNGVYYENINKIIYSMSQDGSVIVIYRDFIKQKSQLVLKDELTSLLVCENRQIAFIGSNRGAVYLLDISSSDFKQILRLDGAEKQKICDFAINIIADPSYALKAKLSNKVKSTGKIVRCICILNHPIPNTKNIPSVQVIIPQRQTGRKNDIYVMMVSDVHNVCKYGFYIAILSTNVETNNPEREVDPAFEIVGPVLEKFFTVSDVYVPRDDGEKENIFISSSFDPQSHFEGETVQVLTAYKKITKKDLDLTNLPVDADDQ